MKKYIYSIPRQAGRKLISQHPNLNLTELRGFIDMNIKELLWNGVIS